MQAGEDCVLGLASCGNLGSSVLLRLGSSVFDLASYALRRLQRVRAAVMAVPGVVLVFH